MLERKGKNEKINAKKGLNLYCLHATVTHAKCVQSLLFDTHFDRQSFKERSLWESTLYILLHIKLPAL